VTTQTEELMSRLFGFVEEMFGPPEPRVCFLGLEPVDSRTPLTLHPDPYSRFRVKIGIPKIADEEWKVAAYLAHEYVHCLNPNGWPGRQATVLEEGLAEHSSIYFLKANYHVEGAEDFDWADMPRGAYRVAFDFVEEVVRHETLEGMRRGVRALRADTHVPFGEITAGVARPYFPNTPLALIDRLSERFANLEP
jgi:hypothetical protein